MKNRTIAALIVTALVFSVTYYKSNNIVGETRVSEQLKCISGDGTCSEWVDTETGVHYYYTYKGGLELRVNADGTPYTD